MERLLSPLSPALTPSTRGHLMPPTVRASLTSLVFLAQRVLITPTHLDRLDMPVARVIPTSRDMPRLALIVPPSQPLPLPRSVPPSPPLPRVESLL